MFRVLKHNHRRLVFFTGDKDFKSMLSFLKREVPDLEIFLFGFRNSMANDIKELATRNKVFYLDDDLHLFYQKTQRSRHSKSRS